MNNNEAKLYEIIGSMLRDARIRSGFTLEQAGEKIGVIAKTIQRYETGERKISLDKLMELTALFGTDYTSFVAAAKRRLKESVSDSDDSQFSEPINTNSQQDVYYLDDEAREIAQQVYERPELRMLFSASKNVSAEDLTAVIALVNRMKKEDD
ncbi:MAG: helix-turn-helix transcriptional regulator [Firmicutes bacterium]|jgi:transcriptional regulator with XRE-family HTH domain|nr:helix-turn-helix transcriptional regulator [Bacillota bacterium]